MWGYSIWLWTRLPDFVLPNIEIISFTTSRTIVAGVAGLIVGVSAAVSMASAAYIQAKHEMGKSPKFSALITGLAYITAVVALSTPYLL